MTKPKWVKVVGVLGIILGSMGILSYIQVLATAQIMEGQKKMLTQMEKSFIDTPQAEGFQSMKEVMTSRFDNAPEWFKPGIIILGVLGIIVYGFYLYGAISFLSLKKGADKKFIFGILFAILINVMHSFFMWRALGSSLYSGLFGLVINSVLLAVIFSNSRVSFQNEEKPGSQAG